MKNEPFVIERVYQAPVERVWKAITNKDDMKQWYFDIADFKPEVGFEFQFEGRGEGGIYLHLCKITEVIIGKKIRYSWQYRDYEGTSFVNFQLFPEGDKTRLKLTHEGLETFPAGKDFSRESFTQGWTALIGDLLPKFLSQSPS